MADLMGKIPRSKIQEIIFASSVKSESRRITGLIEREANPENCPQDIYFKSGGVAGNNNQKKLVSHFGSLIPSGPAKSPECIRI